MPKRSGSSTMKGDVTGMKASMKAGTWDSKWDAANVTAWTPEDDFAIDPMDALDRRTANKRKYTAEEATERRRQMARTAGSSTLETGLVVARNNEVNEVRAATTMPVPADVALVVTSATAQTAESEMDVPIAVEWLEALEEGAPDALAPPPAKRRAFYALLSGQGGSECAAWVGARLPTLLASKLTGVPPTESAAIKDAIKSAFEACDAELLETSSVPSWDGCCALGLVLDLHASPPRAYVASLGTSQAHACVKEEGSAHKAIPVSKGHGVEAAKEKARVAKAGGALSAGLYQGELRSARAFGHGAHKGKGVIIATPDVSSFDVKPAQRFVVLGSEGMWKCATGEVAVDTLASKLSIMDARRVEIEAMVRDETRLAMLDAAKVKVSRRSARRRPTKPPSLMPPG